MDDRMVNFSGFGTLGVLYNPSNGAAFARDGWEPNGADNKGVIGYVPIGAVNQRVKVILDLSQPNE